MITLKNICTALGVTCRALWYNKTSFLNTFNSDNKEIGKPDESLGRKATGPVKWQPVA